MRHSEITDKIMEAFYRVYNTLGYGFLEKVYENALVIELRAMGMCAVQQRGVTVRYRSEPVGDYFADILIDDLIILELKAADALCEDHRNQLINYLKATDKEVGLLLNFGKVPELKRVLFTNDKKGLRPSSLASSPNQPLA